MNAQERIWFENLIKDRTESMSVLEKRSIRGIWRSVEDKYTAKAHFVYELLQNADDAGAKSARFILNKNELVFIHDGKQEFTISDPNNEDADSDARKLGHINSITSVANSSKTDAEIGKFGVGFKAVFGYTQTPRIYNPSLFFRLDRKIIPTEMTEDFPGRKPHETLFVFPFDYPTKKKPRDAFKDISEKLRSLVYPILFLKNLTDIKYTVSDGTGVFGSYSKDFEKTKKYGDCTATKICLRKMIGSEKSEERIWLFSRKEEAGRVYCVGFFLDKNGALRPEKYPAFCFFPTKKETGLNFLIHAPFLLTDSREGIVAGDEHNEKMIRLLAQLAADSLVNLRDIGTEQGTKLIVDDIFSIVPCDESAFRVDSESEDVSFRPFFDLMKEKFTEEKLLPSSDGYVPMENAYWAEYPLIVDTFSNSQLEAISGQPGAKWVFTSFGRFETQRADRNRTLKLTDYIDSITKLWLNDTDIINGWSYTGNKTTYGGITAEFIEKQPIEWLHKFYRYIYESDARVELIKTKQIFLDKQGKAVAAYNGDDRPVLYLPTDDDDEYPTIDPRLLENEDAEKLIKDKLKLTFPSRVDEIYHKIIPLYKQNAGTGYNSRPHFKKFFQYYTDCTGIQAEKLIEEIKPLAFVICTKATDDKVYRGIAKTMYFPDEELRKWFAAKPTTWFVQWDELLSLVGKNNKDMLRRFLIDLGVEEMPRIITRELCRDEAFKLQYKWSHSTRSWEDKWHEKSLDGCIQNINVITSDVDKGEKEQISSAIWDKLIVVIRKNCKSWLGLDRILGGEHEYFYRSSHIERFDSRDVTYLRTLPWLLDSDGYFRCPKDLTLETLSPKYDVESEESEVLIQFLGIRLEEEMEEEGDDGLTEEERAAKRRIERLKDAGFTDEEIDCLILKKKQQKERNASSHDDSADGDDDDWGGEKGTETEGQSTVKRIGKEITRRASRPRIEELGSDTAGDDAPSSDEDEYTKPTVDYAKKINQAKTRLENDLAQLAREEELENRALAARKYTYGWFKALLDLEIMNSGESNANSREISISFSKVEREPGTERTLVLRHPSRYIPQWMEDLADIPMVLYTGNEAKKVAIEVVNVKSYTLRAKLRTNADISGIELSQVREARIDAQNPTFLLRALKDQLYNLHKPDDYSMQDHLCENIEFVFGPPGTGKTTHLAREVLIPLMKRPENLKVLVLTPTNKAADVVTRRVIEIMDEDASYSNWLVRFGSASDETIIEERGVYRDKTFDIRSLARCVTVTTIARFPYDYFMPPGERLQLCNLKWDYIVIDEASMIPLVNIILPLYMKTPDMFIIAGDPFQIQPITSEKRWKDENIYTMVGLNSFKNPTTRPHNYKVEPLITQYRSIPSIGEVFSRLTYDGVLKHYRPVDSRTPLGIEEIIPLEPLTVIKFPVSEYESIYRLKRLQKKSSYQVYSALFSFEFAKHIAELMEEVRTAGPIFKIGIIAPYRAQADVIDKLISRAEIPNCVDVQVDTIHGFQGDECDMIITVFNPPPGISDSKEMFLNKLNIINVSVSRARDYLVIVMPDEDTENVDNMTLIKKVQQLCMEQAEYTEMHTRDLEMLMFGKENFIEENSFSTSHQMVNVYGEPERRYEIRSEDSAVDVQIHKDKATLFEGAAAAIEIAAKVTTEVSNLPANNVLPVIADATQTSAKARFMDMVRMMQMTYSYKPVLLKALMFNVDEDGKAKLNDLVSYFCRYYENRRKQGLKVEQGGIFTRRSYSEQDVANLIIDMPFKRFALKGMMSYDPDSKVIWFDKALWKSINEDDEDEIEQICDEKLDEYYKTRF